MIIDQNTTSTHSTANKSGPQSQDQHAPKVSVCMLVYNGDKFIGQAIESFLAQITDFDTELVISNDNSTDRSAEIANTYKNRYPGRIRVLTNSKNLGMSKNYVSALMNCRGEYIAMLDCDDYWTDPYKLQKQVDFLDSNPAYGVVYTDCEVVDENGRQIHWKEIDEYREHFRSGSHFIDLVETAAFIPMLTTCVRNNLLTKHLNPRDAWFFEDWWLWMRLAINTKFHYLPEKTACYRRHTDNITTTRVATREKQLKVKRKAYEIYYSNIMYFSRENKEVLNTHDKFVIYKKLLMLVNRSGWNLKRKLRLLPLLFRYYPGSASLWAIMVNKLKSIRNVGE